MNFTTEAVDDTTMLGVTDNLTNMWSSTLPWTITDNNTAASLTLQQLNDNEFRQRLIPIIYLCVLMVLGVPGNLLVLIVYSMFYTKSTTHRTFILILAAIDLAACVVSLPFEITEMRFQYTFYAAGVCKFFRGNNNFLALSSIFVILCLSVDRFRRVCFPLKRQITPYMARFVSLGAMALSLVLSWPNLLISGIRHVNLANKTIIGYDCSLSDVYAKTIYPKIYNGILFLIFVTVIVTLIILYCMIGRKIHAHGRFRSRFQSSHNSSSVSTKTTSTTKTDDRKADDKHIAMETQNQQELDNQKENGQNGQNGQNQKTKVSTKSSKKNVSTPVKGNASTKTTSTKTATTESKTGKITRIAFMISLMFILSYLPHLILSLLTAIKGGFVAKPGPVVLAVLPIVTRSVFINSMANPLIYGAFDPKFRDGVKSFCCCMFRR